MARGAAALAVVLLCSALVADDAEPTNIVDAMREEFQTVNPRLEDVELLDLAPIPWSRSEPYVVLARAIRSDGAFQGAFEDEQFGVFAVDGPFTSVIRTLITFPTPRWRDYGIEIRGFEDDLVVIVGQGLTYGDEPREWRLEVGTQ